MKRNVGSCLVTVVVGVLMFTAMSLSGCVDEIMYPTLSNVKELNEANLSYQEGLQEATVTTMTEQHTAMTPELEAILATILTQNTDLAASLKSIAAEKAAAVKGPELSEMGQGISDELWAMLVAAVPGFAGLGLWGRNLVKPSRAEGRVSELEAAAVASAKEVSELKLALAVKAGPNETIPG